MLLLLVEVSVLKGLQGLQTAETREERRENDLQERLEDQDRLSIISHSSSSINISM